LFLAQEFGPIDLNQKIYADNLVAIASMGLREASGEQRFIRVDVLSASLEVAALNHAKSHRIRKS
jgi:hypothetical protein